MTFSSRTVPLSTKRSVTLTLAIGSILGAACGSALHRSSEYRDSGMKEDATSEAERTPLVVDDPDASTEGGVVEAQPLSDKEAANIESLSFSDGAPGGNHLSIGAEPIPPAGPAYDPYILLTGINRNHNEMMGGWGHHLRSLLTMTDGSEWFVIDSGPSVMSNTARIFYKKVDGKWKQMGSVALYPGIQQNMATITDGRMIYSYGISETAHWVLECWFDTANPKVNLQSCNALTAGGVAVTLSPSANYIGAAMAQDKTRVVWWTTVGAGGGGGSFSYGYNHQGKGWNLRSGGLGGYNYVGYVHLRFTDDKYTVRAVAEMYAGSYPSGRYQAAVTSFTLGQSPIWYTIASSLSSRDIWYDRESGTTHVLASAGGGINTTGGVNYYAVKKGDWPKLGAPNANFPKAYRMRFQPRGKNLLMIADDPEGKRLAVYEAPAAALAEKIDWKNTARTYVTRPPANADKFLSAIYVQDPSKQIAPVVSAEFAICGNYPEQDHNIWSFPEKPAAP